MCQFLIGKVKLSRTVSDLTELDMIQISCQFLIGKVKQPAPVEPEKPVPVEPESVNSS